MKRTQRLILTAIVAGLVVLIGAYPLWSPLFINDVIDESFPNLSATQRDQLRQMPQEKQDVLVAMAQDNVEMANETALSVLATDTPMAEDMPTDEPSVLYMGTFGGFDAIHRGEGNATIYQLADGARVLRLENFATSNGPDLHVLLIANVPTGIADPVQEGYVDLGKLKGNIGNQNYDIPSEVNLEDYKAVVIYCVPFRVNFTVAELE
ncbi:MAG: DM13 domain-containing protein [Phototrophicaceae bacterium]